MRLADFSYELPPELIAQRPLAERTASRLLVLAPPAPPRDLQFSELPALLRPADLLVFNDTRVVPARLGARRATGGRVELLLERGVGGCEALVQIKGGKSLRPGAELATDGGTVRVLERADDLWRVALPAPALEFFARHGRIPLPPYIEREPDEDDRERYQSVLARVPGAVAAPTASLHFDAPMLARLAAAGIGRAQVTLHVGAGTFQPIRSDDPDRHRMHAEWIDVPAATCVAIERARSAGGRVVAVGTTVVRALESAARDGVLRPFAGDTEIFIRPGHRWRVVDALLTNFHLPESTLLVLVCAFAGRDAVLGAYRHAVAQRYRFFSYGDAMFLTRAPSGAEAA
ncbi:MAG: tRNA preQ1(34) S-adenosylmethionine ribosyltransferase-isomerase QueA [Steroidobacteraceae bacterium]